MTTAAPPLRDQVAVSDDAARFIAAMLATGSLPDGIVYFIEKPWKWQDDYAAWIAAGRPDEWGDTWDDAEPVSA